MIRHVGVWTDLSQGTLRVYLRLIFSPLAARWSCSCNGRSQYCLRDNWGLHCIDCQGNTTGRHCERCKDGFYRERAGLSCSPCHCHPTGEKTQYILTYPFHSTVSLKLEFSSRFCSHHLWQQGALQLQRRCHRRKMQQMFRWTDWTTRLLTKVENFLRWKQRRLLPWPFVLATYCC